MSIIGQVLPKWAFPVTVAAILIAVGVGAFSCRESAKVKYAEAQAKVDQHKADQDAKVAEALNKKNATQAATTKDDDAKAPDVAQKVAQARAAVARAQAKEPTPPPPTLPGEPQPATQPVDIAALVAERDALKVLVKAQEDEITLDHTRIQDRDKQIATLILSDASWHSAYDNEKAANVQKDAVIASQKGLLVAAKLKYGAGGLLTGYLAGKLSK